MTITILGAGAFGSALAVNLAQTKSIRIWSRNKEQSRLIRRDSENTKYLKGIKFPKAVDVTSDLLEACKDTKLILTCIPSQNLNDFLCNNFNILPNVPIVICSKGIDSKLMKLQSQIVYDFLPKSDLGILTGPSFASEIARGLPTALTLACQNDQILSLLQKWISGPSLRIYTSNDVIGTQLGGALKNVIAIACGICHGAKLGENARIALMTRGLNEIIKLGDAMGANKKTFYGLSGLGDLSLTCNSMLSRNFRFGYDLGSNTGESATSTVEGIKTSTAAIELFKKYGIDAPIITAVHAILTKKKSLSNTIENLLSRSLKQE